MRPRERARARACIERESSRRHCRDLERDLPVAELAHVEVARPAVEVLLGVNPAEEDVARGLHEALALHDSLAVVREAARAEVRLEHRRLRLFHLEEQGIVLVAPEEQHHPAAGSDAADTDDLTREIGIAEALEQHTPVARKRVAVAAEDRA